MSTQAPLNPAEIAALHRFSMLMETTQTLAPGYEAIANGPCGTGDPKGPRGAVLKSGRAGRSRGTTGRAQRKKRRGATRAPPATPPVRGKRASGGGENDLGIDYSPPRARGLTWH